MDYVAAGNGNCEEIYRVSGLKLRKGFVCFEKIGELLKPRNRGTLRLSVFRCPTQGQFPVWLHGSPVCYTGKLKMTQSRIHLTPFQPSFFTKVLWLVFILIFLQFFEIEE